MPDMINNELQIDTYLDCRDALLKFQQVIESEAVEIARNHTTEKGEELKLEMSFRTFDKPPVAVYKEIEDYMQQHNKGSGVLGVEATFTSECDDYDKRYRWLFEGDKFETIETNLTYSQREKAQHAARQAAEHLIKKRVEDMRKERDDLDVAIRVMEQRYPDTIIPF